MRRRGTMAARNSSRSAANRWMLGVLAAAMFAAGCDAHSPTERSQKEAPAPRPTPVADRSRPIRGPELPEKFRGDDLRLSTSTSIVPREPGQQTATVVCSANDIRVGTEPVVELPVDASKKRGGEHGLEIIPLREELKERSGSGGDGSGGGHRLELAVDRLTNYRLLAEMLYTAGQAAYDKFGLVVTDREGARTYEANFVSPELPDPKETCLGSRYLDHLNHHYHYSDRLVDQSTRNSGASRWGCGETWGKMLGHESSRERLNLTVGLNSSGILVGATGEVFPPREDCPEEGPTICLRDESVDVEAKLRRARELREEGSREARDEASELLRRIQSAYDWRRLYETLVELKAKYPNETVVIISANPNLPVQLIVRAMDVSRFVLPRRTYESSDAFRKALRNGRRFLRPAGNAMIPQVLFSDPILAIAK